jgi:hypothetical protein
LRVDGGFGQAYNVSMIHALVIAGIVVLVGAILLYIVLMLRLSPEEYERVTRNWPEGE